MLFLSTVSHSKLAVSSCFPKIQLDQTLLNTHYVQKSVLGPGISDEIRTHPFTEGASGLIEKKTCLVGELSGSYGNTK